MANFTIRVELHGAKSQDYATLAQKLAPMGIVDVVNADNGSRWSLPTAEYAYSGEETAEQVLAAVKSVANTVAASSAVVVAKIETLCWDGLPQVQPLAA